MFELPDAKRVRRQDLRSPSVGSADDEYDAELRAILHSRIEKSLALDVSPLAPTRRDTVDDDEGVRGKSNEGENDNEKQNKDAYEKSKDAYEKNKDAYKNYTRKDKTDDDIESADDDAVSSVDNQSPPQEFEFRLFRGGGASTESAPSRIILESVHRSAPGGLVPSHRPIWHYMARPAAGRAKAELEAAAVTADDLLAMSRERWPGLEVPWRVTTISSLPVVANVRTAAVEGGREENAPSSVQKRRRRPGKKMRIKTRLKHRTQKAVEETKAEKERAAEAKRKTSNRQKKLRKRAKKKQQEDQDGPHCQEIVLTN